MAKKQLTEEQEAKLAKLDARLDEIEAMDYIAVPESVRKEYDVLCKERWEIVPPIATLMSVVK